MAVGDPRRRLVGRAAFGTLLAAAVFLVFTGTKQIKAVYFHAPWSDDPYDTVLSFTMFFVPLVAAAFLIQVSLCRKSEPLPTGRVVMILRGCRVAVGAMVIELLSAWVAVAVRANRPQWTAGATGVLVSLLALSTIVTAKVIVDLYRAPRLRSPDRAESSQSDWLKDVVTVAERESRWLGPLRRPGLTVLGWADRALLSRARRRPLVAVVLASGLFAVTVFGWQAVREGYHASVTLLSMGLGFCGMFAFLVVAGSYLGVVRSTNALRGLKRRALDAGVVACIVAIATLAFRGSLWWVIGSSSSAAGPAQFATLVGSATLLAFGTVFTGETLLRSHSGPAG
jgi:hypothetical protein